MSKNTKTIALFDGSTIEDSAKIKKSLIRDTDIEFRDPDTGETIFRTKNKVIIPGSGYLARQLFDLVGSEITPSYNEKLNIPLPNPTIEPQPAVDTKTDASKLHPRCLLFCIGTDGCGAEDSQIFPVDYKKWIKIDSLVPFRYPLKTNDLSDSLREVYFGRTEIGSDRVAYYFKRFDTDAVLVQQFVDGTPVGSDIYDSAKTDEAETYVELILKITKEDVRDYFIATTGINDAKVNTVSLCTAWPTTVDGKIYWQDIRPFTKLNIANEPLIDITKGIDIIYHIYM